MKKCSRCNKEKPAEEFNFKYKKKGLRQKSCRVCTRLEIKNHYDHNREYYLNKANKRNSTIRQENRIYLWKYLTQHPCVDCGEKDPIVLEFDHIKDKRFNINFLVRNNRVKQIANEISKCIVRCANCHRRKTAAQFSWYKYKIAPVA